MLLESIVTISIALSMGVALLTMWSTAYRIHQTREVYGAAQSLLDSALAQTLRGATDGTMTVGEVAYRWTGRVTSGTGYRQAHVALEWVSEGKTVRREADQVQLK